MKSVSFSVVLIALLLLAVPASGDLPFNSGFECGTFAGWAGFGGCATITLAGPMSATALNPTTAEFLLSFDVSAVGGPVCFEKTWKRSATPASSDGFWIVIESASGVYAGGTLPNVSMGTGPGVITTDTHYCVSENTTGRFHLYVVFSNAGGTPGSYWLRIAGVAHDGDGFDDNGDTVVVLGTHFRTSPPIPLGN